MKAELRPGQDFKDFLDGPPAAGQRDESIRHFRHHGLALMHGGDHVQAGQAFVRDFLVGQGIFQDGEWNLDFNKLATFPSNLTGGVGEDADVIDFSTDDDAHPNDEDGGTAGIQNTVNALVHTFTFDTVVDDDDGTRSFTWDVPANLVTQCGVGEDNVFVIEIFASQDNQGETAQLWAVLVKPVNQAL